jgi:GTPase SAR1 family protein
MSLKRILVVGDAGVGKTQYIRNIIGKGFEKKYIPTLGKIHEYRKERVVLYDYPGQEIYSQHKINENIDIVCYLYDMTSRMSYNNINNWKQMIRDTYGEIPISYIIGTKSDSKHIKVSERGCWHSSLK